ncbi:MAG: hypothetical protein MJH10_10500 [Epibacterium sp.]|nr:hypothetical protein [Epibacterium sp.]NQX73970.1 hypothetical protein [Epibacterium sp.]
MAAKLIVAQAMDPNGTIQSGAKLNIYDAGTTTRRAIYTTSALSTQSTNPAVATSDGAIAVWIDDTAGDYKATLTNSAETATFFNVDNIDPAQGNLLIYPLGSANGGGGGGDVSSVNGQTGAVVLDPDDFDDTSTAHKFVSAAELSKLAGIETGADVTDAASVAAALSTVSVGAHSDVDLTGITNNQGLVYNSTTQTFEPGAVGGVSSVNGQTGAVVLDADDVDDTSTAHKFATAAQLTKIDGVESGAQVNIVTSVNSQISDVTLDADDIDDTSTTNKFATAAQLTKIDGVEVGADVTDAASVTSALAAVSVGAHSDVDLAGITNGQGLVYNSTTQTLEPGTVGGGGSGDLLAANNLSDLDNAATARTNLGLQIGADVLAYDANLQSFVTTFTLPTTDGTANQVLKTDGAGALSFVDQASGSGDLLAANNLSDLDDAATARTNLGLGATDEPTFGGVILEGDTSFNGKTIVLQPRATASENRTAILNAFTEVGSGGMVVLPAGEVFEVDNDFDLTVANTYFVIDGTLRAASGFNGGVKSQALFEQKANNVVIMGSGTIDCAGNSGGFAVNSGFTGCHVLGDNLKIVDSYTRAAEFIGCFSASVPLIVRGLNVYWTSAGVASITASSVLPLPINVTTSAAGMQNFEFRDNIVNASAFSIANIVGMSDNLILMRFNASGSGGFISNFAIAGNRWIMPQATAYTDWNIGAGPSRRRPTCMEIKCSGGADDVRGGSISSNYGIGGDLGISCGNLNGTLIEGNTMEKMTAYCLESASGDRVYSRSNYWDGVNAFYPVSMSNMDYAHITGDAILGPAIPTGIGSTYGSINTVGVKHLQVTGASFVAKNNNAELLRLNCNTTPTILVSGCSFIGTGHTGIRAVNLYAGTADSLSLIGNVFEDIDGASIYIDATVTSLVTVGNTGVSAGAFTDAGSITTHIDMGNTGISGLTGNISAGSGDMLGSNNLSDVSSIATSRSNLGLGSIATQAANSVAITGGSGAFTTGLTSTTSGNNSLTVTSSSGNASLTLDSASSNGTSDITFDTTGDGSRGRFVFAKAGVTRGILSVEHNASAGSEKFVMYIGGGTQMEMTNNRLTFNNIPTGTSSAGLSAGHVWCDTSDGNTLKLVT